MSDSKAQYVVPTQEMRQYIQDCMQSVGTDPDHAAQLADNLIVADQRGHYSHGLNRLKIYLEDVSSGNCKANGKPFVIKQKGATAWVDGDNALGVVVGNFCTKLAVQLAKDHGVGWVVAKRSNHFGIAGYYPLEMARQGLLGIAMTNTSPLVFPNRGAQTAVGTNPISIIAEGQNGDKFALDMATSTVAIGKIELAKRKGQTIPPQWGADGSGKATTDPEKVLTNGGALLPLGGPEETGGYKGTGLGMFVELCCGILGGAHFGKNIRKWGDVTREADLGQCFVAVDPECFAPGFAERLQRYLAETRGLKPSDPDFPILIPGDKARASVARSEKLSGIVYGDAQIRHLEDLAKKYNVKMFSVAELSDA